MGEGRGRSPTSAQSLRAMPRKTAQKRAVPTEELKCSVGDEDTSMAQTELAQPSPSPRARGKSQLPFAEESELAALPTPSWERPSSCASTMAADI